MNNITLLDDWYDAETGRYMVILKSPHGARHRLSFLNIAFARRGLNRLMRPVAGQALNRLMRKS